MASACTNETFVRGDGKGGSTLRVQVALRSSANKVLGIHNNALKVALTAPPLDGAANKALVDYLAKLLDVPKQALSIMSGDASRQKVLYINGVGPEQLAEKLGLEPQGEEA